MATQTSSATISNLPDYIAAAQPNPVENRAPWYKSTAPTYAGIFLWFVFWDQIAKNGLAAGGLPAVLLGVVIAGLICHFLFYLVPGLLGMKTGLPLYIVGTSTFGAAGGLLMPGFLMGLLQFGWLAVNTYFSCKFLALGSDSSTFFYILCVVWAAAAAFVGLKGIQYVAKVATFLPLIPLAILLLALLDYGGSAASYRPATSSVSAGYGAMLAMVGAIVGFFATAGAAGVDFGMNNRDRRDVQWGGVCGILLATVFTAGIACIAVAGAHVVGDLPNYQVDEARQSDLLAHHADQQTIDQQIAIEDYTLTNALKVRHGRMATLIMIGLTLAAFPGACFSSFIAANSFKTVMPRVNSFLSVGIGALVSIALAVTRTAGDLGSVFVIIGASFGPICGAMCVDYLLAGRRWPGPRAGFNPAGWIAWLLGFLVGIMPNLHGRWPQVPEVPAAPVAAFLVGALVYFLCAKAGCESAVIPYGPAQKQQA